MCPRIIETVTFEIALGNPVALSDLENHRGELQIHGVYFLRERKPRILAFDPYAGSVFYIGKAISETVFSRCTKHCAALLGNPNMRPGKNFRLYRDTIFTSLQNLWVIPGLMDSEEPYLISCAEEYLLHKYAQRNGGVGPRANTK